MTDHAAAVAAFRIEELAATLHGRLDSLNACVECCDRHPPDALALRWSAADGRRSEHSFGDLRDRAIRFAGLLRARGIGPGDVVAGLLPRIPDLLAVILGTWRAGAVYQPLFTAFGPRAIEARLDASAARMVVTDAANRPKLDAVTGPEFVLAADLPALLAAQPAMFEPVMRGGNDPFLLMFTSGTTGPPKGVAVPLRALLGFGTYLRQAVDLRPTDRFWNIADPGWAYGLYYAVTGPLLLGHATTLYDGPFTAASAYAVMRDWDITNLAGAPTAFRMMIAAGPAAAAPLRGQLRAVSSAGEPLNPEVIRWFAEHLGVAIHDHYGQTELGMVVCNHHALHHPIHPGSAGVAAPGWRVAVLDDADRELPPHQPGVLAVDIPASPLHWFTGYLGQPAIPPTQRYYRTGDTVEGEPGGGVSFVGRSDDIITSAGYRIGPFEVESALIEHPAVIEAAVVGKPDPERTEIVKAFVVLAEGTEGTDELAAALQQHVRTRLSAHAYPREVAFVADLPKTPSGKLQRFLLRARG